MSVNLKPGDHVFLKHKDGFTYEGDIKKVEEAVEMLTLYNIILLPRQSEIEGFRKFDFREILEIKRWVPDDPVPAGSETICSDETPPDELPTNSLKISEDEYNNIIRLQKEFRYLKACDNNFYEAVNILKQSSKIGICMKDVSKGRLRRGSVFAVSSNDHIFIFDIEVAGDRMFDKGLREILESKDIVKIVYDCRLLSDCLLTKHIVDLENVMDVEANDILLVYYDRGIVRKHTRSLNYLIDLYLGIPNAVVDDEQFQDSWTERPLEVKNQVLVAAYVSYLIPLQKSIEECYMQKMKQISALFNNHWKKGEEIFSAGTGSKYTPYFEIKELVRKNAEIRGKRRSHKDQENDSDSSHSSTDPSTETFSNLRKVKKKRKVRSSVLKEVLNKHKLPDKSLSKKIKLPINKRISRSCMPLKVRKICKIKKKPVEKPKIKPSPRSLNRKKFSNPKLFKRKKKKKKPSSISESDPEIKGDEKEMEKFLEEIKGPKSYDPVTPQMLVDVLQSPLLHRFGATIDMIIRKLKTRKKTFQSSPKNLKEEVKKKLDIAKKLSIVEEDGGHYWITDVFKLKKLTPQKVSAFWKLYGKNCMMPGCAKPRKNTSKYLSLKN